MSEHCGQCFHRVHIAVKLDEHFLDHHYLYYSLIAGLLGMTQQLPALMPHHTPLYPRAGFASFYALFALSLSLIALQAL